MALYEALRRNGQLQLLSMKFINAGLNYNFDDEPSVMNRSDAS